MKYYKLLKLKNKGEAEIRDFICSDNLSQSFYKGTKVVSSEKPKIIIDNKSGNPTDFIMGGTSLPIVSNKVKELLLKLSETDDYEFIPLDVQNLDKEVNYSILNILNVLDCVDFEKSEYRTYRNSEKIKRIDKLVLKEESIKGKDIFYLKDFPVDIYISEKMVSVFNENDITGYRILDIE